MALDALTALQAAQRPTAPETALRPQRLLLAGAGGALGRAVLHEALASARFAGIEVLTAGAMQPGLRGLHPTPHDARAATPIAGEIALVVFDRGRDFYGRDEAWHLPEPAELPALARRLRAGGVHTLVVVCPTAPSLLPQALQQGLADLNEQAIAALGFDRLLFVRPTQDAPKPTLANHAERLAAWMLSQLRYMIPARERPVRAQTVAAFVFEVLRQWPGARVPAGTRVAGAPLLWAAAQQAGPAQAVANWLNAEA
ncbi:MAG TPA: hypothetical protein VFR90_03885 [Methylibium sp.]|uniref:hypothetical protein n=1 Tax=Methylibium sp. TaxID=2067992 RepID=UPI002DBB036F|nr:hypothetical protein [Methylibium sp.]HEU4458239.1 hypothetical protein [Methylibium sp.]